MQLLTILLAIFALGFLIFIHELGHYFLAKRAKIRVEVFSIGFGKPIFSWMRDGVKWQICILPFGGYVKMAGMHKENNLEPHDIKDGFFGKRPVARIKVALAGPLVNIVFAMIVFTALYLLGGREQPFSHFTKRIGWVDKKSELYKMGVRPGDEIVEYGDRPYSGMKDLLFSAVMDDGKTRIKGYKIDYATGKKIPFDYEFSTYSQFPSQGGDFTTIGIESPANYVLFKSNSEINNSSNFSTPSMKENDRLLWVNGELVFSTEQLQNILNESTTYLTVQRGSQILHTRVPRVKIGELRINSGVKDELEDWRYEIGSNEKLSSLFFIPYDLNSKLVVTAKIPFIDQQEEINAFSPCERCLSYFPLQKGDRILAIDGQRISNSLSLLEKIQKKNALIIAKRDQSVFSKETVKDADQYFDKGFDISHLNKIVTTIGTDNQIEKANTLVLLNPIELKKRNELNNIEHKKNLHVLRQKIGKIEDLNERENKLKELAKFENSYVLGFNFYDKDVLYNPTPLTMFFDVFSEIQRTMTGLVTGMLSPKYLAGPIGIMHVVQQGWSLGLNEALYWIGMISLNLGLLNLLPIPILDGGHIVISLVEMVTKKPLKAKTMERLILPFVILLIGFFIYVTYHDLSRLFSSFF